MINGPLASLPRPWFSESLSEYQARVGANTVATLQGAETWRAGLDEAWRLWREADAIRETERRRAAIETIKDALPKPIFR